MLKLLNYFISCVLLSVFYQSFACSNNQKYNLDIFMSEITDIDSTGQHFIKDEYLGNLDVEEHLAFYAHHFGNEALDVLYRESFLKNGISFLIDYKKNFTEENNRIHGLIKEFTKENEFCSLLNVKSEELFKKAADITEYFNDEKIKIYKLEKRKLLKSIKYFSFYILKEKNFEQPDKNLDLCIYYFLRSIRALDHIDHNYNLLSSKPDSFIINDGIINILSSIKKSKIDKQNLISESTKLFDEIEKFYISSYVYNSEHYFDLRDDFTPYVYDALFKIIHAKSKIFDPSESLITKLVNNLYIRNLAGSAPSDLLQINHATLKIRELRQSTKDEERQEYKKNINILEDILERDEENECFYQQKEYYNYIFEYYNSNKNRIKSIEILKKILILGNNLDDLIQAKNLVLHSCASILTKDYETALEKTQEAIEVLAQTNVNSTQKSTILKLACKHRLLSLQKLERTDEVQKILLEKQEQKISKLKAQGRFVKQLIKYSQKKVVVSEHSSTSNVNENVTAFKKPSKKILNALTQNVNIPLDNSKDYFETSQINMDKLSKDIVPVKKLKVKTRGKANDFAKTNASNSSTSHNNPNASQAQSVVTPLSLKIEDLLKPESSIYKIFCKFFEKYQSKIKDCQVQISMHDVELLMKNLDQDMDHSKGKGSHTKITLNFSKENDDSFVDEQMLILANHTYLKPYQIKQLREKFIENGLYPKDLEEKLQQKWQLAKTPQNYH